MTTIRRSTSGDAIQSAMLVMPHDTNAIEDEDGVNPTALYIGQSGKTITIKHLNGNTVTYTSADPDQPGLLAGVWHRMSFTHVMLTGTDAFAEGAIIAGWCG